MSSVTKQVKKNKNRHKIRDSERFAEIGSLPESLFPCFDNSVIVLPFDRLRQETTFLPIETIGLLSLFCGFCLQFFQRHTGCILPCSGSTYAVSGDEIGGSRRAGEKNIFSGHKVLHLVRSKVLSTKSGTNVYNRYNENSIHGRDI